MGTRLAIDAARAFIRAEIVERGERKALPLLERVATIAAGGGAIGVFLKYAVDPLLAVPLESFRTTSALHTRGWPQIVAALGRKRDTLLRQQSRPRKHDFLKPAGLSVNAFAKALRVPTPRINDVVLERRGITADTAMRLACYFGGGCSQGLKRVSHIKELPVE